MRTTADIVIFHLKRHMDKAEKGSTLYEQIKHGKKTSEWRDNYQYWLKRLIIKANIEVNGTKPQDLTEFLWKHKIWFVEGYPKDNLPRLEADIARVFFHPIGAQLEICFINVKEVLHNPSVSRS